MHAMSMSADGEHIGVLRGARGRLRIALALATRCIFEIPCAAMTMQGAVCPLRRNAGRERQP